LQLRLGDDVPAETWTAHLPEGITYTDGRSADRQSSSSAIGTSKPAKGHVRLHLLRAAWNGAGKGSFTKYTAHTLGYVMHMMAIMHLNHKPA
jgi:hypothetical protein